MADLKELLLSKRIGVDTAVVEIEGVGALTVRGLSRAEFILAGREPDTLKQERKTLAWALVDPVLTEEDVAAWQRSSPPAEINTVAAKINELSGIVAGADKSGVPGVREEP